MKTVYVSIGNSDGKLTQLEWAAFYAAVDGQIEEHAEEIHGAWVSDPVAPFQNACWCIEIERRPAADLTEELAEIAASYKQDSIAWAEATTVFIKAASG